MEVTLSKACSGLIWQELIKGDASGQEVKDENLVPDILKGLHHFNSEEHVSNLVITIFISFTIRLAFTST